VAQLTMVFVICFFLTGSLSSKETVRIREQRRIFEMLRLNH
jgi:hypothetical protein